MFIRLIYMCFSVPVAMPSYTLDLTPMVPDNAL